MLEAESYNVRVINEIACGRCSANGSIEHGRVSPRLSEQNERGRSQYPLQIGQDNFKRDGRMKDAGMSDNPEEFVNTGPRDGPGEGSFGERFENLEGRVMMLARLNLSVDQDVRVNRLHGLGPVHKVEQRISIQQVDPGELSSLPAPKAQSVRFPRAYRQRAPKKVIDDRLESSAFLGSLFLQFEEKLILDRQRGSSHMQKHTVHASRCQAKPRARPAVLRVSGRRKWIRWWRCGTNDKDSG
jgi:hypothetical protein